MAVDATFMRAVVFLAHVISACYIFFSDDQSKTEEVEKKMQNLHCLQMEEVQLHRRGPNSMSLFVNPFSNQEVSQEKINIAEVQYEAMNSTFNNILESCLEKCIPHDHYSESELNKGEMSCVDRCVAKIHYSNRLIGAYVQTKSFGPNTHLPHYAPFKKDQEDNNV